ncbi:glycoside hydrolase family 16 protein [Mycobacterium sp. AMU20-3851]|uniref:glycoside hydrolase family 16 protein n=1 Tax=Mycobacterium sp. AMU20-3851 TaxID=3122055 RepID=UPI003754CD47
MRIVALLVVSLILGACALVGTGTATGQPRVLLNADFDGPAGTAPDAIWHAAIGGGGWGNDEIQFYTDHPDNVSLDGNGHLVMTSRREADGRITSSRLTTQGSFEFTFGRAEARIALPAGTGLHPAFWLLGANLDEVGWPASGEIDVIETLNHATEWHSTVHAPQAGTERGQQLSASGPVPFPLAGVFRTYWVERTPGRIVTGVDDLTLLTVTPLNLQDGATWVFDQPFNLLFSLAVGGTWPGPVDASTPFPASMLIDHVRVTEL